MLHSTVPLTHFLRLSYTKTQLSNTYSFFSYHTYKTPSSLIILPMSPSTLWFHTVHLTPKYCTATASMISSVCQLAGRLTLPERSQQWAHLSWMHTQAQTSKHTRVHRQICQIHGDLDSIRKAYALCYTPGSLGSLFLYHSTQTHRDVHSPAPAWRIPGRSSMLQPTGHSTDYTSPSWWVHTFLCYLSSNLSPRSFLLFLCFTSPLTSLFFFFFSSLSPSLFFLSTPPRVSDLNHSPLG